MRYVSEEKHQVSGHEVIIRELRGFAEYHVFLDGEKYEVWLLEQEEEGRSPGWYTQIEKVVEGPWRSLEDLLAETFLSTDGYED